jgi:signal transduction histidine kinase
MKRWPGQFHLFPDNERNLKVLKVVAILSPALLVFLLELLRHSIFEETPPMIIGSVVLFVIVIIALFFFSRFVFANIDRLQKENARSMRELAIMNEVYQTLDEFHNLNALLSRAMDKLIQITSADSGELYLVDEESREVVHKIHAGIKDDASKRERQLQLKEQLMGEGVLLNQRVVIKNLESLQSGSMDSLEEAGVRSLVIIPLKSSSGTIGVACLFSMDPEHFKQNEADLLLNLGNRIALAIERARLYEKVQAVAVVEERERISSELHDGLAQVLGYVITKSQATRQLLQKMIEANDYLVELEDVAQDVYTDTREAILGLRTTTSGDRSMVSALNEYAARFNQMHRIKTELIVGDQIIPSLSPHIELQAIRIAQEALSNVRKHAEATRATIKVDAGEDQVTILIEDDGKGFDFDTTKEDWTKFGLQNMKERAASIHSSLRIESTLEKGTRVTLSIPLTFSQTTIEEGK